MLLKTLKTLVVASKNALQTTCGLKVIDEDITLVRNGILTFPALGKVEFRDGTLHQVQLGCDDALSGHLAENFGPSATEPHALAGMEQLANGFMEFVLQDMEGRRPEGWVVDLDHEVIDLQPRGVRSFGFRFQTEVGQLYLMVELPSRVELEQAKVSDFLSTMIAAYLPRDWVNLKEVRSLRAVDNFLVFMRKTEVDVQVEIPVGTDEFIALNGILIDSSNFEGRRALRLSVDLSEFDGTDLRRGDTLRARVGVQDRAVVFNTHYLGSGHYEIADKAQIGCAYFTLPEHMVLEQRRRTFRIMALETIPVEIQHRKSCEENLLGLEPVGSEALFTGRVADISFSGARIIADRHRLTEGIQESSEVVCRVHLPGQTNPLEIQGVVRRSTFSLADRNHQQDEIGVEFSAEDNQDRAALECVRDYVLSQQRTELAKRVHVSGVDQW